MTLIAGFRLAQFLVLLGDTLISGGEEPDRKATIPTVSDIATVFPKGAQFTITGMKQKICLVSDNLAIGWAGSYIAARTVISELIERNRASSFTVDSLASYFNNLDTTIESLGVSFIAAICDPTNNESRFINYNGSKYNSSVFGQVFIAGSGTDDFVSLLRLYESALPKANFEGGTWGAGDIATFLVASLLIQDSLTGTSLQQYYGGGYELALAEDGKIQKEGNLTYVFWHAKLRDDGSIGISLPRQIHTHTYLHDVLAIRSLLIEDLEGAEARVVEASLHLIPPVNRNVSDKEISTLLSSEFMSIIHPTFVSGRFINLFVLVDRNNRLISYKHYNGLWVDPPIKLEVGSGASSTLTLQIEGWFIKKILDTIYPNLTKKKG